MIFSIRNLIVSLSFIFLSACASVNSPPTCPDSTGVQCARVDQLDNMVDSGQLGQRDNTNTHGHYARSGQNQTLTQIWIAPYQDKHGHYHPARMIETRQGNKA